MTILRSNRGLLQRASITAIALLILIGATLGTTSIAQAIPLVSGLGGTAGYGTNILPANDDGSTASISVAAAFPRGLNFFGTTFNAIFVNNNGNVTFRGAVGSYTPTRFPTSPQPMIAAWWGDVDTRGTTGVTPGNNLVYWDVRPGQFTATWHNVGYYSSQTNLLNDFQIQLLDRSTVGVAGDFDIELRYNRCQWTTGSASGGTNGVCAAGAVPPTCSPAQAGFDAADPVTVMTRRFSILPGSLTNGVLALCTTTNAGTPGLWRIEVRSGAVAVCGNNIREMGEDCDGTDTPTGRTCGMTCRFGSANGTECTAGSACLSGNCVDGVCCNQACAGQCEACDIAGARGACLPVMGTPRGTRRACTGTGTCGGACDGALRSACSFPDNLTPCGDASCMDGVVTRARTCDGAGACAPAMVLRCEGYACVGAGCLTECATSGDCSSGFFCSSRRCLPATPNGGMCTSDAQCTSGRCVDGVCCNTMCSGQCEACDTMGMVGTCVAVTGAPRGMRMPCAGAAGETCTGLCGGTDRAACSYPDAMTSCRSAGCAMGASSTAATCDGRGSCPGGMPTACAPYVCSGAMCATSCTSSTDCAEGNICVDGRCVARRPDGANCTEGAQCTSGSCADGVCCSTACSGQCEACDATGMVGTCVAVMGAPHGMRRACAGAAAGGMGTCSGVCDGTARMSCIYPGSSTVCRPQSCREGASVNPAGCDGMGACPAESTGMCGAYACGPEGCRTRCTTDAECAMGNRCNGGSCAPPVGAGTTCQRDNDCMSGVCAQGVCCDRPCDGVCLACDLAGSVGVCAPRAPGARAGAAPDGGMAGCVMCDGRGGCAKGPGADAGVPSALDGGPPITLDGGVVTARRTGGCGCSAPGTSKGSPGLLLFALLALGSARASRRRR